MRDPNVMVRRPNRGDYPNVSPWIEEQIWGHRIFDSQSPWLLFLEFLTVAEACYREGRLLTHGPEDGLLHFRPAKRMYLRNILFNNEEAFRLASRFANSDVAWDAWLNWIEDNAAGVEGRDFSYLRRRFRSFHEFVDLLGMLRASAVESDSNKRWTSRFVFPFGPNALYEDVNIKANKPSREYINFGRTGEMLYLMMCRASSGSELRAPLERLLAGGNSWDRLLGYLQPAPDDDRDKRGESYLPYRSHPRFDALTEDWRQVFALGLPGFDTMPHLVALGALHVMLYHLEIAAEWAKLGCQPHLVCEVVAPKKSLVRQLSIANFQYNNSLPGLAVERYIADIEESAVWREAAAEPEAFAACLKVLQDCVWWPSSDSKYDGQRTPEALITALRQRTLTRHRQHVANVHRRYGRDVGLISKRGTNRLRYAPTDSLLKTLVVANIETRLELSQFLDRLYRRYGLIFAEQEAAQALSKADYDTRAFKANRQRLEQRLATLGMLRRLSDSCAYVINPYGRRVA